MPPFGPSRPSRLLRLLGLGFGIAVILGGTIGVGILRTPGSVVARLGSEPLAIAVWVLGGMYALLGAFALLALLITAAGIAGVIAYSVSQRTHEIGIRMALGAQRSRVVWMILREVVLLAAVGLAISVPTALAASKLVESFLFGMKPNDPLALIGSAATLVTAAILAGYLPARNASRIDPMIALRHE